MIRSAQTTTLDEFAAIHARGQDRIAKRAHSAGRRSVTLTWCEDSDFETDRYGASND